MKEHILELLSEALPAVNFQSDFLFSELDSLGVVTIMVVLSREYNINIEVTDITPKNFKTIDSLVSMVQNKLQQQ